MKRLPLGFQQRRAIAHLLPSMGYGHCMRCRLPWYICEFVNVDYYDDGGITFGCFALCTNCWCELPPDERVQYYWQLVDLWDNWGQQCGREALQIKQPLKDRILAMEALP